MAEHLEDWIESTVDAARDLSPRKLAEEHFFRDPVRPMYSDDRYFFSPADGVILYQKWVAPDKSVVDLKGVNYSLRDALRNPHFDEECLVIGIFMTLYDVHVNRVPYPGRLSYEWLPPLETQNHPMLDVELALLEELQPAIPDQGRYLHANERVVNRVYAPTLQSFYYLLQLADYDVRCITPFELRQNWPVSQNQRFSQIRFGSQVDLIIPRSALLSYTPLLQIGMHVEAGVDPIVEIKPREAKTGHTRSLEGGNARSDS